MGGGRWSKGILEFRFGPNLGLRLEAGTKLNNIADIEFVWWWVVGFIKSFSCQIHQRLCQVVVLTKMFWPFKTSLVKIIPKLNTSGLSIIATFSYILCFNQTYLALKNIVAEQLDSFLAILVNLSWRATPSLTSSPISFTTATMSMFFTPVE